METLIPGLGPRLLKTRLYRPESPELGEDGWPELFMAFKREADAQKICNELRADREIDTEVVRIGNPQ